jgi:hypothetical protein
MLILSLSPRSPNEMTVWIYERMRWLSASLDVLIYIPHIPDFDTAVLAACCKPFTLAVKSYRRYIARM